MPTIAQALQVAWQHHQAGRLDQAVDIYRQVLSVQPRQPDALHLLGVALLQGGQHAQAVEFLGQAAAVQPALAVIHNHLGAAYGALHQVDLAEASFRRAVQAQPDFAEGHLNLGLLLAGQCRLDEAVDSYRQAIALRPDFALAHNNLGIALANLGRTGQALEHYDRALALDPAFAEAHVNRALAWLSQGDFARGWDEYEWRWQSKGYAPPPHHAGRRWDGAPLAGRALLLDAEQGLGDTLQFVRYAAVLRPQAGRILVRCQGALVPLLRGADGVDLVVSKDDPLPPCDLVAPLLSLPKLLGTQLHSIPRQVPYLHPDPQLARQWHRELSTYSGLRVGIVWQGSRRFQTDRLRSAPLVELEPLARVPGVKLLSLQKGPGSEQLAVAQGIFPIKDLGTRLDETAGAFQDTAAVMSHLDLVVSTDTAAAHLAGALGRPVWLALPFAAEWRWLAERDDSPWYPTMRLFRQPQPGDWPALFARMAQALAEHSRDGAR